MQRSSSREKQRRRSPSLTASSSPSSSPTSSSSSASTAASSSEDESHRRRPPQPRFPPVAPPAFSARVAEVVADAKRKHRTDIKPHEWNREGFAGSDVCELPLDDDANPIKREHCSDLSVERFVDEYERPCVPVVIEGVPEAEGWRAAHKWTLKQLRRDYKRVQLKCGEDDDGKSVRMKFKHFYQYMTHQTDDSPLYIFDSTFDEKPETKPLLHDYNVPRYFPEDLFALVGEDRRPPYRWFLVGPKRSGTCVHVDPLGTSAWNTLLVGRKRWVLFPPDVPKRVAQGKHLVRPHEDDEAVNYFMDILPRIKRAHAPETLRCIELMQYPGDTIFVPGGWWHAVLNVEDTVAVTQNFCSSQNFERVWCKTRSGRKRMAVKWLRELEQNHPHLVSLAHELNARDSFVMFSKPSDNVSGANDDMERSKKKKKKAKSASSGNEPEADASAEFSSSKKKKKKAAMSDGEDEAEQARRKKAKKA